MNVLCFASEPDRLTVLLRAVARIRSREVNLELFRTIGELYRRLCEPRSSWPVIILYPDSHGEMGVMLAMREMFSDAKVILVLASRDDASITAAHKLGPRYLGFADEDLENIAMIVERMCRADIATVTKKAAHTA